ncbi:dipeptide ABC transporter permease DppB [Anaerolineales bacterium]
MTQFIIRRLLQMVLVLFAIALLTFLFMRAIPGNPFDTERGVPERTLRQLEQKYNLDEPLHMQFLHYMEGLIVPFITDTGAPKSVLNDSLIKIAIPGSDQSISWINFGPSYRSPSRTVNDIIRDHLPVSIQLGVAAMMVAMIIGIPAGIIAALHRNQAWDYAAMSIALIGVSVPVIVSGPILRYIFGVQLGLLPAVGWGTPAHVILPAFALGFSSAAVLARLTRASLLQVLHEDYIRTARAKGLSERIVVLLHAMKNALIPVVTILGPLFAFLITGSFVTELIFGIPGLGAFFVTSITNRDYPVIMGTTLLFAFIIVVMNLLVDIVYAWIDPRISYS